MNVFTKSAVVQMKKMKLYRAMLWMLSSLLLTACQSEPPKVQVVEPEIEPTPVKEEEIVGESLITASDVVLNDPICAKAKRRPTAFIEDQQVDPSTVALGQHFIHSLVYAVCASDPDEPVSGKLYRKIFFKGKLIHSEPKAFDLKPGRWSVKARIDVPSNAKPGDYSLKTEFVGLTKSKRKVKLGKITKFKVHS